MESLGGDIVVIAVVGNSTSLSLSLVPCDIAVTPILIGIRMNTNRIPIGDTLSCFSDRLTLSRVRFFLQHPTYMRGVRWTPQPFSP